MEMIDQETGEVTPVHTGHLITLDPDAYTAAVYEPFRAKLARAISEAKGVTYDVQTGDGMSVAKMHRSAFRSLRTGADKAREQRKAPILEIGRLLDSRCKSLIAEIAAHEARFDMDIKAEEKRKEDIRIAAALAESKRIGDIQSAIIDIYNVLIRSAPLTSAGVEMEIADLTDLQLDGFDEFLDDAKLARLDTLNKLAGVVTTKAAAEAETIRLALEREELARLRVAEDLRKQAELDASNKRLADERAIFAQQQAEARAAKLEDDKKRFAADAEAQARRDADAAIIAAQRKELERIAQLEDDRRLAIAEAAHREDLERIAAKRAAIEAEQLRTSVPAITRQILAERVRVATVALDAALFELDQFDQQHKGE